MKIAIIGGAGFVGSHIARAYLDAGHDVFVIDSLVHGSSEAIDPRARFYQLDIRDGKLQSILQTERPDIVSHHAVQRTSTLPGEYSLVDADVQIRGLLNVLDSCVHAHISKFIFASSGNSFYQRRPLSELEARALVNEDVEMCPQDPQDISKMAGEWYVRYYARQYRLPHVILRYADIYGERDPQRAWHPLTSFLFHLSQQRRPTVRGTDQDIRDHIFIDDVVRANLSALERGRNETLHISSAQGYTIQQFYRAVAHLLRCDISPMYISASSEEPGAIILDNKRAQRILNWKPEIDFLSGVALASERLKSNVSTMLSAERHPELIHSVVLV